MVRLTRFQTAGFLTATAAIAVVVVWFATSQDEHFLRDINGVTYGSLEHPVQGRLSVLFFLTPDWPIANQYAPEIHRICDKYESGGAHSTSNPNNPSNPPRRVTFGEQSTDEMGSMTIEIVPVNERDLPAYAAAVQEHVQSAVIGLVARGLRGQRGQ